MSNATENNPKTGPQPSRVLSYLALVLLFASVLGFAITVTRVFVEIETRAHPATDAKEEAHEKGLGFKPFFLAIFSGTLGISLLMASGYWTWGPWKRSHLPHIS